MAMKCKSSDLNTKLEFICVCEKSEAERIMWIIFFDTAYNTEEQRENMVCTKPMQDNTVSLS
jgi:hypothetical protein